MSVPTISPNCFRELFESKSVFHVIDVRTPSEFREVHATCAINKPLENLNIADVAKTRNGPHEPLYLICKSGQRGEQACKKLLSAGETNVYNIDGGTAGWEKAGLPVVRGKKAMSLERQVRIAAGSLVFLGAVLSIAVHPYFIGLSGFVGAGLIFAGVTDTCGMGMLIARMPWNQVHN